MPSDSQYRDSASHDDVDIRHCSLAKNFMLTAQDYEHVYIIPLCLSDMTISTNLSFDLPYHLHTIYPLYTHQHSTLIIFSSKMHSTKVMFILALCATHTVALPLSPSKRDPRSADDLLDQYNQLQQQTEEENLEMQKAQAFWNPLESTS